MMKLHKGDSHCRICHHTFKHHCIYIKVEQGDMQLPVVQPLEIVPCDAYAHSGGTSFDMTGKCGCLDWQPQDNLEFLELKSKQSDEKAFD